MNQNLISSEMTKYLVVRPKDTIEVLILPNKSDGKFSFVNLTKGHICPCRFSTISEALADMDEYIKLGKIISYQKL